MATSKSSAEPRYVIHVIANAHLDPVWLWDWREGLNEGIVTCQTMADLLEEDREAVFSRGEAAVYQHIQQYDPILFKRITRLVRQGRWDVVGGTYIQPDTNLPDTETFCRHYLHGQRYFAEAFGRPVRVAWAADSFGHSAGLPEVLAQAGIQSLAFTRPSATQCPIASPAFWWRGPGGSEVLAYRPAVGWYGCDRDEMPKRLDAILIEAEKYNQRNIGCYYGVGNHGGGTTRRLLADIRAWAKAHPDVKVVHAGLHGFFDALHAELAAKGHDSIPTHATELNYTLRGCYSSVAKYKFAYRATENLLNASERTDTAVSALTNTPSVDLYHARNVQLFNSFHDILPGSSIERATDEQLMQLGYVDHHARVAGLDAINRLAAHVDTRVKQPTGDVPSPVSMLVFNPLPHAYQGYVEVETSLDYRPVWKYTDKPDQAPVEVRGANGQPVPFQSIATEHSAMQTLAWRKRVLTPVQLPAMGWSMVSVQYTEKPKHKALSTPAVKAGKASIGNGTFDIKAKVGDDRIHIQRDGKPLFGKKGLSAVLVEDQWGSWGSMSDDPVSFNLHTVLEKWKITLVEVLEKGPLRAVLFVRLAGAKSRLDLTISLCSARDAVDVQARVLFDDRCARLKLVMGDAGESAVFDVPGGQIARQPNGEVPGGRWVKATGKAGTVGFASNGLYNFDLANGDLRATVCRATRYANDAVQGADAEPWRPAVDCGELKFRFVLGSTDRIELLSRELEHPPVAQLVAPHDGPLPRVGSIAEVQPSSLRVTALKTAEDGDGYILRTQETTGRSVTAKLTWLGSPVALGKVQPNTIATWRLTLQKGQWAAVRIGIAELD